MKPKTHKATFWIIFSLAIIVNLFIIISGCLPGNESTKESGFIVKILVNIINLFKAGAINETNYDSFAGIIRKLVGHFLLFMLSGTFSTLSIVLYKKPEKYLKIALFCGVSLFFGIFLASLTEGIQLIVPHRSGEYRDIIIDSLGYFVPVLIIYFVLLFKHREN